MAAPRMGLGLGSPSSSAVCAGDFLGARAIPTHSGKVVMPKRRFVVSSELSTEEKLTLMRRMKEQHQRPVKLASLRRGKVSPRLRVPKHIQRPSYVGSNELPELSSELQVHDAEGIAGMRAACELAARVLEFAGSLVRPSVTTDEIDKAVHKMIVEAGAYPSLLGYVGYPKSIYTSVNECVCHGIPDSRELQSNDIVNVDVAVFLNGYHGNTSRTFLCGEVNGPVKRFVKVAEECLEKGISVCRDGMCYRKIGKKISKITERCGFGVVERFVGHGIGTVFHSRPLIFHHCNDSPGHMVEGQTFTIEPVLTMGEIHCVTWEDGWTTVTADRSRAAQFAHTVLITRTGAEILTKI